MNRNVLSVLTLSLAAAFSGSALAQYGPGYNDGRDGDSSRSDIARVTRVDRMSGSNSAPRDHVLRQECWNERTNRNETGYYRDESGRLYKGDGGTKTTRTVIGAIIGGALGNQVGDGRGQTAATIAGAAAGAAIANNTGNNKHYGDRDNRFDGYDRYSDNSGVERRCRTVEEHVDGRGHGREQFRVSYVYAGQNYQAFTNYNPGRTLRVVVDVRPEQN